MPDTFDWKPDALGAELAGYEPVTVLRRDEDGFTCVVKNRQTGKKGLLKATGSQSGIEQLKNEETLLRRIHESNESEASLFPKVIFSGFVRREGQPCYALIRSFIPGRSLEEAAESRQDKPGLPRKAALNALISVMEQLRFLHSLPVPIIHRDVKPQNVILDDMGVYHLIDLGISRQKRDADGTDTRVMGTRLTAPPEQFGYRQTDERSDIYSAGVLLRYCLTGDYDEKQDAALDADIAAIVKRATMFDPQTRYQNAGEMLGDLLVARYGKALNPAPASGRRRRRPWLIPAIACALAVCAAMVTLFVVPKDTDPYVFREKLIEQAARQALGIPEGDLTRSDLKGVTALYIFGRQVYSSPADIWFQGETVWVYDNALREAGLWKENGGITSLEDIRHMPNLRELCLYRQNISDITALKDTDIMYLGLGYNPLDDLSPLTGNEHIVELNISGLKVSDTRVIGTLKNLRSLNIGATAIGSISGLEGLPITEINLCNVFLPDWSQVKRLTNLQTIETNRITRDVIDILGSLNIEKIVSLASDTVSIRDFSTIESLEYLDFRLNGAQALDERLLPFPKMMYLFMQGLEISSLSCLSEMKNLYELSILGSNVRDYSGLDGLEKLSRVLCSPDQMAALQAMYPDKNWLYMPDVPA